MNYKASQKLVDILLKHGFIETTKNKYPKFYKILTIEREGDYNPYEIKRSFAKGKLEIVLDFTIEISYESIHILSLQEISENELASVIYFGQSNPIQKEYLQKEFGITRIFDCLCEYCKYGDSKVDSKEQNHLKNIMNIKQSFTNTNIF